ncbi:MAG: MFS transporter [Chloroflexi bacterium]|nr:MFS transporter [Chloroflexota bacterium]
MSQTAGVGESSGTTVYNPSRLFALSVLALVTAGVAFSIRALIIPDLQRVFFDPTDSSTAASKVAAVAGEAFLGFAISIFVASPLCDYLGMGRLLGLSCLLFIVSTLSTLFAGSISAGVHVDVYWVLWLSMLVMGFAWGLVEAVINPLIATLYPDNKTQRLNALHAWWPGGTIIGGLIGYALGQAGFDWKIKLLTILVPAVLCGILLAGTKFPPTERVASAVSDKDMWKECLRPMFIVWWCCMWLTAASELAPGQWVQEALTRTVHMQGILLTVYVGALMFTMRHFAGPLAHRFSPVGLLWISSLLAALGLVALSYANSPLTGFLAATVWGIGVCYMWPTMLAVTSERFPRGGALLLGLMGTAGNLSSWFVLAGLGKIYDHYKNETAQQAGSSFDSLQKAAAAHAPGAAESIDHALSVAAHYSFLYVAALPAILLIVFALVWLQDRSLGGYKIIKLAPPEAESMYGGEVSPPVGADVSGTLVKRGE